MELHELLAFVEIRNIFYCSEKDDNRSFLLCYLMSMISNLFEQILVTYDFEFIFSSFVKSIDWRNLIKLLNLIFLTQHFIFLFRHWLNSSWNTKNTLEISGQFRIRKRSNVKRDFHCRFIWKSMNIFSLELVAVGKNCLVTIAYLIWYSIILHVFYGSIMNDISMRIIIHCLKYSYNLIL